MNKTFVGVDNGVSGTIGIIRYDGSTEMYKVPVRTYLNYTKVKSNVTRIDYNSMQEILKNEIDYISEVENAKIIVAVERPMVNPTRFKATLSAIRALESLEIILECLQLPYIWLDSKQWQNVLLPTGIKGKELKTASLEVGNRLFPEFKNFKHEDRDGILIAEYLRRNNF
jgi:hypothetical protein